MRVGLVCYFHDKMKGHSSFNQFELCCWLSMLLLLSGDVHENPGPSTSSTSTMDTFVPAQGNLSLVHYNVQSILNKKDILFGDYDILAFTETWLNPNIYPSDLLFPSFHTPFRRDRQSDPHGGIIVYVKSDIFVFERRDLEVNDVECLWLELKIKSRRLLFGTFYRPPSSCAAVLDNTNTLITLAFDTDIKTLLLLETDFNHDMKKAVSRQKIDSLYMPFSMSPIIRDSTHFSENSQSLINIFLVTSPDDVIDSGVGEPFLDQNVRFHCPIYCILRFSRTTASTSRRKVWTFSQGDYVTLRNRISTFYWHSCFDKDIDI